MSSHRKGCAVDRGQVCEGIGPREREKLICLTIYSGDDGGMMGEEMRGQKGGGGPSLAGMCVCERVRVKKRFQKKTKEN